MCELTHEWTEKENTFFVSILISANNGLGNMISVFFFAFFSVFVMVD